MANKKQLSFPLYHGSSTLYLDAFQVGKAPDPWPHKKAALALLQKAWTALANHGQQPDWWIQKIMKQEGGNANWRHGELYVTPSQLSATNYAKAGGAHGGELFTQCADAISLLYAVDKAAARSLIEAAPSIAAFLKGGGEARVVEIGGVNDSQLLTERDGGSVHDQLKLLNISGSNLDNLGQQLNFVLKQGCGSITAIHPA